MKEKTEIMLCRAFVELLRKYSFPKITIQMITTHCGVNRQTFYYHFDNIYDLMGHAFEYELLNESRIREGLSWEESMGQFLNWMKMNRSIIKNLLSNVDGRYLRQAIYPIVNRCMSNGYSPNQIIRNPEDGEEEFLQRFLILGITQCVMEWADNDFKEPEDELIHHIFYVLKRTYNRER